MICFKPLKLSDIEQIKPYFSFSHTRTCDNTVGGSFMWRDFFGTEYAVTDNTMFFKVNYLRGLTAFSMPLGEDVPGALAKIRCYCDDKKIPMVICTATIEDTEFLKEHYKIIAIPEADWSDYLYSATDLAAMSGRKYNGQRNHINRFIRENPYYSFKPIEESNLGDILLFFKTYSEQNEKGGAVFAEEKTKVIEVLNNFDIYGQFGTALYVSDKVAAFSIGEIIGDTLYVHIEKADTHIAGAYQMLVKEFAAENLSKGISFINREEDVGDEGLRTSKISYHPCDIIGKYTVLIM